MALLEKVADDQPTNAALEIRLLYLAQLDGAAQGVRIDLIITTVHRHHAGFHPRANTDHPQAVATIQTHAITLLQIPGRGIRRRDADIGIGHTLLYRVRPGVPDARHPGR